MAAADDSEGKTLPKRKVCLHRVEIPEAMKDDALIYADSIMDKYTIEKDIATNLKKYFDTKYGGTWHCVVGANYGSSITHQTNL